MYTAPPSSLKFDYSSFLEWLIFLLILFLALYCAWVIKNEKKNYKEEAAFQELSGIFFLIANWWSLKEKKENKFVFYRADTHYDWEATFEFLGKKDLSSKEYTLEYLNFLKIELDNSYESFGESEKGEYLFRDKELLSNLEDFYRCESIGTCDETKRVYVDIVTFRLKNSKKMFSCLSVSSILNGCVEGPYFEEALVNAKLGKNLLDTNS